VKQTLVVLLGLPRSGTTMATAMFDVHPDIVAWFEPWHASPNRSLKPLISLKDFIIKYKEIFNIDVTSKKILMFKETTDHQGENWIKESINNIVKNDNINVKIIWLIRDINHAYLSRVHTARKYWGHPEMKIDTDSFKEFINFAYKGFKAIEEICSQYDSCMLSYENLVLNTENTLKEVMNFIGIEMHPNQLEYYKHFKTHKSAGDPEVTHNPKPVNPEKIIKRDNEWLKYKDVFINSLNEDQLKKYNEMMDIINNVRQKGFVKI
jgi:hypothetical protein